MSLKWIPKMVYGSGPTTLALTQPIKIWTPMPRPIGGSSVSDAGVPESFVIRREQRCKLELRFLETELAGIEAWLVYAQGAQAFDFYFDKNVNTTKYTVYLDEPAPGNGEVQPVRDSFKKIFTLPIVIRSTTNTLINVTVF